LFPFGANAAETNGPEKPASVAGRYHLVDTPAKFKDFFAQLRRQKRIAVDLETTGLDPLLSEIVGFAFSWEAGEAWYLAVRAPEGEARLEPEPTLAQLARVLENSTIAKVNQNIKYDSLVLRNQGVTLVGIVGDPMVADYLLHAGERSHNMEDLAR